MWHVLSDEHGITLEGHLPPVAKVIPVEPIFLRGSTGRKSCPSFHISASLTKLKHLLLTTVYRFHDSMMIIVVPSELALLGTL